MNSRLKERILVEAHSLQYWIDLGSIKMYRDLKNNFLWEGMKQGIAHFIKRCDAYRQVKARHQRPKLVAAHLRN